MGLQFYRLHGPNFHPISFGYALCFFSIYAFASGHRIFLVLAVPILVVVGSKGAMLLLLVTLPCVMLRSVIRSRGFIWGIYALLILYPIIGVSYGLSVGDYHAIGFIGGLEGFLSNPLGHGLGTGGNLVANAATLDWGRSQLLGTTESAVESAVGVLLHQMGIGAVAVTGFYGLLSWFGWRQFLRTGHPLWCVAGIASATVLANGVLQEEALFAPLAMGSIMLLTGLLAGQQARHADRRLSIGRPGCPRSNSAACA